MPKPMDKAPKEPLDENGHGPAILAYFPAADKFPAWQVIWWDTWKDVRACFAIHDVEHCPEPRWNSHAADILNSEHGNGTEGLGGLGMSPLCWEYLPKQKESPSGTVTTKWLEPYTYEVSYNGEIIGTAELFPSGRGHRTFGLNCSRARVTRGFTDPMKAAVALAIWHDKQKAGEQP